MSNIRVTVSARIESKSKWKIVQELNRQELSKVKFDWRRNKDYLRIMGTASEVAEIERKIGRYLTIIERKSEGDSCVRKEKRPKLSKRIRKRLKKRALENL